VPRGYVQTVIGTNSFVEAGSGPAVLAHPHAGRSSRMYAEMAPYLVNDFRSSSSTCPARDPQLRCRRARDDRRDCRLARRALDALDVDTVDLFASMAATNWGLDAARYPSASASCLCRPIPQHHSGKSTA